MFKFISNLFKKKQSIFFQPKDTHTKLLVKHSKFPFYRKLNEEIIQHARDDDELDKLIAYNIFTILQENKKFGDIIQNSKVSAGQKAFYVTRIVEGEILNGGFNQLFYNYHNDDLPAASIGYFKTINAGEFAILMQDAVNTYARHAGSIEKFRDGTLESFSKSYNEQPFAELDERFYRLNKEDLLQVTSKLDILRIRYVRENIHMFI